MKKTRKLNSKQSNKSQRSNTRNGIDGSNSRSKSNQNFNGSSDTSSSSTDVRRAGNHPEWYNIDPVITRDAATFPYTQPTGAVVYSGDNRGLGGYTVPGVMSFEVLPTVGTVKDASHPINIAAQQIYAYVNRSHSRNSTYDAADFMLYLLSMAEVYSYVGYLGRVYGVAQLYSYHNRYLPDTLLKSMKVDPMSIKTNLANFRLACNFLIHKVASYVVPATMTFFDRRQLLYREVYSESETMQSQMYLFNPAAFGFFDWTESKLSYHPWDRKDSFMVELLGSRDSDYFTFDELIEVGNNMIDRILGNAALGNMHGEILAAFGSNIRTLDLIPENYSVVPVSGVNSILEQMMNAVATPVDPNTCDVVSTYLESTAGLKGMSILTSNPKVNYNDDTVDIYSTTDWSDFEKRVKSLSLYSKPMVSTGIADPLPSENMSLTALTTTICEGEDGEIALHCGTEIITRVEVWTQPGWSNVQFQNMLCTARLFELLATDPDNFPALLKHAWGQGTGEWMDHGNYASMAFRYAPKIRIYDPQDIIDWIIEVNSSHPAGMFIPSAKWMLNPEPKYTLVDNEDIRDVHRARIMQLFNVPVLAKNK